MTGSMGPKSPSASRHRGGWARNARRVGVLSAAALILSSCGWRGIANVPLPGGPGTVDGHSTIYIQMPETLGLIGVAIVLVFYFLVGGRVYCSWVCPVNVLTDTAGWLRRRLGIKGSVHLARDTRYWVLAMTLVGSAATGMILWELVNPVSMLHRGLIFGMGAAWAIVLVIFLFDLFIMSRGWCGRLCPVGAFYGLIGRWSPLRVSSPARAACNDCMDCFEVCPEPQVIRPALKGAATGAGPVILSPDCTNCGRCIDVCSKDVFRFGTRFNNAIPASEAGQSSVMPSKH